MLGDLITCILFQSTRPPTLFMSLSFHLFHPSTLLPQSALQPWVARKVQEFLGKEESTLVAFILSTLLRSPSPPLPTPPPFPRVTPPFLRVPAPAHEAMGGAQDPGVPGRGGAHPRQLHSLQAQQHVGGAALLGLLEPMLDEEAEILVLKMWRMLIFKIKRVELGLTDPSDDAAHLILLAFPRLLLRLPSAAAPTQSLTSSCASLARRFINGDWQSLFSEAVAAATLAARPLHMASARSTALQARLNRAKRFAKCGDWSRSLAALEAGELAPPSSETVAALSSKHPPAAAEIPDWVHSFTPTAAPQLTVPVLQAALQSAPRGTAAGPSGWFIEHLRDMFLSHQQHLPSLLHVFQNWLQGDLPLAVRPFYTASNLVALQKPHGGVRPIAIGEVLPRLLSRCITLLFKQQMRETFLPHLQFGVAVPAVIEIMSHAVCSAFSLHPDWVVLQLDIANAFNSFNRVSMFEALRRSPFSSLIPFFRLFYSTPSPLHYRSGPLLHTFQSASGVRCNEVAGSGGAEIVLKEVGQAVRSGRAKSVVLAPDVEEARGQVREDVGGR
ncbi:unnamed protein product [Closterium sp. Naga37s-1]|nr:unnamed protein product [Closterium sp. Naga37s-1]